MQYSVVISGGDARPCVDRVARGELCCGSLHMVKAPLDQNDAEVLNTPATTTDLEASSGQVSQMQRTGLSGQSLSSSDAAASGESELHSE